MKKHSRLLTILTIVTVIVLTSIAVSANSKRIALSNDDVINMASIIKDNGSNQNSGKVVAKANGLDIYENEVELYKQLYTLDGTLVNDSYKDVIKKRAKIKVLYNMAVEGGYAVSLEEAKLLALDEKALYDQNLNDTEKDFLQKYIEALGLSEEQYWNEYYPKQVQLYVSIEKLKVSFIDDAVIKGNINKLVVKDGDMLNGDDAIVKQHKLYLNNKINEIESNINVEILESKYNK